MMKKNILKYVISAIFLFSILPIANAKSCGSYVKNGKRYQVPCSLGKPLKSSIAAGQTCKAEIKVNGLTVQLRHQCVVKRSGHTGAEGVVEPSGSMKIRLNNLKKTINTLAEKHGIDPALAHALITVESAYQSDVVSSKGAIGLMQLMPTTASSLNISDPFDSNQNIDGGLRFLAQLLKRFNNNNQLAIAAYNAGPNAVSRYSNSVPPFPETQNYVKRVIAYRDKYRNDWKKYIY